MEQDFSSLLGYIEEHLTESLDGETLSKKFFLSRCHLERAFGMLAGIPLGEYVRRRRLSLAAADLLSGERATSVAFKYGYNTVEGFSRAFRKFHGINPSKAGSVPLKAYPRLELSDGEEPPEGRIQTLPALTLVGYSRKFSGAPFGEERFRNEDAFFSSTRFYQWLLIGASSRSEIDYCVISDFDGKSYDFSIAYELDEWTRDALFREEISGVNFVPKLGLKTISLPERTYAVFRTSVSKNPLPEGTELRKRISSQWLPRSDYLFASSPEVDLLHWRGKERFVEIRIPVTKKCHTLY